MDLDGLGDHAVGLEYDFLKLFIFSGMDNNGSGGNDISPEKFSGGSYFAAFDFSTSFSSSNVFSNPVVRAGNPRLTVTLDKNIGVPVVMILFAEFPSTIKV